LERLGDCSRTSSPTSFSLELYIVHRIYLTIRTYPWGD
jgi:hypothetical protein